MLEGEVFGNLSLSNEINNQNFYGKRMDHDYQAPGEALESQSP